MASIGRTDDVLGGKARIEGTRIGVLNVYELVVAGGYSTAGVADQFHLSLADVHAALTYYYERPEEMDTIRERSERLAETLRERSKAPAERTR